MPDIARSIDYLKTKLTVQALRDLLETFTNHEDFQLAAYVADVVAVNDTSIPLVFTGNRYDPQGWFGITEEVSDWYSINMPAYSWVSLPRGLYLVQLAGAWATNPGTGTARMEFGFVDDAVVSADPVYGIPLQNEPFITQSVRDFAALNAGPLQRQQTASLLRVRETANPTRFVGVIRQSSGSPVNLASRELTITRISP